MKQILDWDEWALKWNWSEKKDRIFHLFRSLMEKWSKWLWKKFQRKKNDQITYEKVVWIKEGIKTNLFRPLMKNWSKRKKGKNCAQRKLFRPLKKSGLKKSHFRPLTEKWSLGQYLHQHFGLNPHVETTYGKVVSKVGIFEVQTHILRPLAKKWSLGQYFSSKPC